MRRNLSDTDVGILDLRKFPSEDNVLFHIPLDWCYAMGGVMEGGITDDASARVFFTQRFNEVIIEKWGYLVYMRTTPGDASYLCSNGVSSAVGISEVNVDDNYIELEWTEL